MISTVTGLKFVTYTISGEDNYSRLTEAELVTLRKVAAESDGVLVITGVSTDRRRSVR